MFAAMSSPAFLGLYITLSALALGAAWYSKQRLDPTRGRALDEEFSRAAKPIEVAYMIGGSEQVARHILMGLVGRGYLETQTYDAAFTSQLIVSRAEGGPSESLLTRNERELLALIEEPRSVSSLLEKPRLHEVLAATCEQAHAALVKRALLLDEDTRRTLHIADGALVATLIATVGAKLVAGAPDGHAGINAAIVLCVGCSMFILGALAPGLTSDLGVRTIKSMRSARARMRARLSSYPQVADGQREMLAALFDASILAQTDHAARSEARGRLI